MSTLVRYSLILSNNLFTFGPGDGGVGGGGGAFFFLPLSSTKTDFATSKRSYVRFEPSTFWCSCLFSAIFAEGERLRSFDKLLLMSDSISLGVLDFLSVDAKRYRNISTTRLLLTTVPSELRSIS